MYAASTGDAEHLKRLLAGPRPPNLFGQFIEARPRSLTLPDLLRSASPSADRRSHTANALAPHSTRAPRCCTRRRSGDSLSVQSFF